MSRICTTTPHIWRLVMILVVSAVVVGSSGIALAHKEKLPPDALSLVKQAAALLAQDPKMAGEARERLEAALESKDARGVDLKKVKQALDALGARDIPSARRALVDALVAPAAAAPGPSVSPGAAPQTGPPMAAQPASPGTAPQPQSTPANSIAAMKMAEPLVTRFAGTGGEVTTLVVGLAFVVLGVATLLRGR